MLLPEMQEEREGKKKAFSQNAKADISDVYNS